MMQEFKCKTSRKMIEKQLADDQLNAKLFLWLMSEGNINDKCPLWCAGSDGTGAQWVQFPQKVYLVFA